MRPQLELAVCAASTLEQRRADETSRNMHAEHPDRIIRRWGAAVRFSNCLSAVTGGNASIGRQEKPRRSGASSSKFGVILKTAGDRGGPGSRLASPCMLDAIQMRGVQSKTRIVLFYRYWVSRSLAEGVGFEPTRERKPPGGFQDRCLKPLGHPSNAETSCKMASRGKAVLRSRLLPLLLLCISPLL